MSAGAALFLALAKFMAAGENRFEGVDEASIPTSTASMMREGSAGFTASPRGSRGPLGGCDSPTIGRATSGVGSIGPSFKGKGKASAFATSLPPYFFLDEVAPFSTLKGVEEKGTGGPGLRFGPAAGLGPSKRGGAKVKLACEAMDDCDSTDGGSAMAERGSKGSLKCEMGPEGEGDSCGDMKELGDDATESLAWNGDVVESRSMDESEASLLS